MLKLFFPKRKLISGTPADESIEAATVIGGETEQIIPTSIDTLIIRKLQVTYENRIPRGTDMYPGGH